MAKVVERASEKRFKDLSTEMQKDILENRTLSKEEKDKILKKQLIEQIEESIKEE